MHMTILIIFITAYFNVHSNAFYYAVNKHIIQLITVTIQNVDQTIRDTIVEKKLLKQHKLLLTLTCMYK